MLDGCGKEIAMQTSQEDLCNAHNAETWVGIMRRQCGDASGTGLFNTADRKFDEERMRTIDDRLPEYFPQLIGPNEVI